MKNIVLSAILLFVSVLAFSQTYTVECEKPVKTYEIVAASSEGELADSVASKISDGLFPEGPVVIHHNGEYYQQVVSRKNINAQILDFYVPILGHDAALASIYDVGDSSSVLVTVPNGSSLTSTVFGIVLSPGATSDITTPHTFTDSVATDFTITSESGFEKVWEVVVDIVE